MLMDVGCIGGSNCLLVVVAGCWWWQWVVVGGETSVRLVLLCAVGWLLVVARGCWWHWEVGDGWLLMVGLIVGGGIAQGCDGGVRRLRFFFWLLLEDDCHSQVTTPCGALRERFIVVLLVAIIVQTPDLLGKY